MLASVAHGGAALHLSKLCVRDGSRNENLGAAIRYTAEDCSLAVELVDGEEQNKCGGRVLSVGEVCNAVQYHLNEFSKLNGPKKT